MTPLTLETVFEEHFSFVWRCLRALGVAPADLDDVTQEVFVIVHRRFADLNVELGVRPWLYGILSRVAQNYKRVARRASGRLTPLEDDPVSGGPTPEQSFAVRQAAQRLECALSKLEPGRREVFWLIELEGLTVPEVSAALQVPLNTTYSRLRLARADFNAALSRLKGALE